MFTVDDIENSEYTDIKKAYCYYDGPLSYHFYNESGDLFFAHVSDWGLYAQMFYMVSNISKEDMLSFEKCEIDYHELFQRANHIWSVLLSWKDYEKSGTKMIKKTISYKTVEGRLPREGIYLFDPEDLEDKTNTWFWNEDGSFKTNLK